MNQLPLRHFVPLPLLGEVPMYYYYFILLFTLIISPPRLRVVPEGR